MAAKGSFSKETITAKILEVFPGAFPYEKEIRIPMVENGETIQIKCVLTCAKVNVENGGDTAMPGIKPAAAEVEMSGFPPVQNVSVPLEPTEQEKENVKTLLNMLGF